MSSSVVRQLQTEIRIAGSPLPFGAAHPARSLALDGIDDLVGDVRAIAREADQHLVEYDVVDDRGPGIALLAPRP